MAKKIQYEEFVYIMMNKPAGVISATEDNCHKTVIDLLNDEYRTYDIFLPEGWILTLKACFCLQMMEFCRIIYFLPKKHVDKKYYVKIAKPLSENDVKTLENGIKLGGKFCNEKGKS